MAWWLLYQKSDGTLVSETSVQPTSIPPHLAAKKVANRPDYQTHQWDPATRALVPRQQGPAATIKTASPDNPNQHKDRFTVGQVVAFQVAIAPPPDNTEILVPIDRLDANNAVVQPAVAWIALNIVDGRATSTISFDRSGRYGVGPWTSRRFRVPLTYITVVASPAPA